MAVFFQHQAGRGALSFFDLGAGVLPESEVVETALELWWAELAGLGPEGVLLEGLSLLVVDIQTVYEGAPRYPMCR